MTQEKDSDSGVIGYISVDTLTTGTQLEVELLRHGRQPSCGKRCVKGPNGQWSM
jgi:hypothetical protein